MRSVKLTGSAARPASPAAPRPSVLRKPRRLTTPSPLIPTWTMFDSNGMAVPLTPGDEFSRVDECPVNVFKDFDAVTHFVHVGRAGCDFLRVGLSRQDSKIKGVQGGPIVRRGRQDLAQHGPWPGLGPVVDHRAVHQEKRLAYRAHDVIVGDGGVDAKECVECGPRSAEAHGLALAVALRSGRCKPGGFDGLLAILRLLLALILGGEGRFAAGTTIHRGGRDSHQVVRQPQRLAQGLDNLVGAKPAGT